MSPEVLVPCDAETQILAYVQSEDEMKKALIAGKVEAFDAAVEGHENLEIDAFSEEVKIEDDYFKVLNHRMQDAFKVPVSTIVKTEQLAALITALDRGVFDPLHGVTRIVGYYSRVRNWNKSKVGELKDRHVGNYFV